MCIRIATPLLVLAGGWATTPAEAQQFVISIYAVDKTGNVYIADCGNALVRKVSADGITTTVAGTLEVRLGPPFLASILDN